MTTKRQLACISWATLTGDFRHLNQNSKKSIYQLTKLDKKILRSYGVSQNLFKKIGVAIGAYREFGEIDISELAETLTSFKNGISITESRRG